MKFKLLLLLLFCSTVAPAQIQREKGSLLLKDNQMLTGEVTYFYDDPANIILQTHQNEKEIFSPYQVAEIKLDNGEKFVAKPYTRKDSVLILQVLIESPKMSLFRREEGGSVSYYVSKKGLLYRLENNERVVEKGERTFIKYDHQYIGTLSFLMPNRMDLVKKLDEVELSEQDLTDVLLEYNKGDVSYHWKSGNRKAKKEPNWVAFMQYSQYGAVFGEATKSYSSGKMIGLQYYFSQHSRSSFKVSLDYSRYTLYDEELVMKGVGIRYEHDIKQAEKYNFYLTLHVADVAHVTYIDEDPATPAEGSLLFLPRFGPGVGFEAKPLPGVAVYGELNNLLNLQDIYRSFSFGVKYDIGSIGW